MAATPEKRVALVIGNAAYVNATPLKNPRNDAEAMSVALERLDFSVIPGFDVGRDGMEDVLGTFENELAQADVALLFFAGHGLQVKGHNYLIPVDAEIKQELHLRRRAFSLDEVLGIMTRRARSSLLFLDACRDNPFSRSLISGMRADEQSRVLVRSGLAELKASQGSFIAFATAPDNVALDGKGKNSPFTDALLAHIDTPGLSISDLMIEVRKSVLSATSNKQEPWDQSSLRERFFFKRAEEPAPQPVRADTRDVPTLMKPILVDERTIEHTRWLNVSSRETISDLEGFIVRFPKGEYIADAKRLAWNRIEACADIGRLERFLSTYPESERRAQAERRLATLIWPGIAKSSDASVLKAFASRFASAPEAASAIARTELLGKQKLWSQPKRNQQPTSAVPSADAVKTSWITERKPVVLSIGFILACAGLFAILVAAIDRPADVSPPLLIVVSALVIGTAVIVARSRGPALTGVEAGTYWFGSALFSAFFLGPVFQASGVRLVDGPDGGLLSGWIVGGFLVIGSAILVAWKRSALATRFEIALYWLGCAFTSMLGVAAFADVNNLNLVAGSNSDAQVASGLLVAGLGSSVIAALILRSQWAQFGLAELAVYATGTILPLLIGFMMTGDDVIAIALAIVSAGALLLYSIARGRARKPSA